MQVQNYVEDIKNQVEIEQTYYSSKDYYLQVRLLDQVY